MRVAIVPGALGIALICIAFFMSTHADTPIDSPGTAESLSDPAPQAARTEFPGSSPASLPEPEPEPTWFRHVIDGRLVYEGSTPHEEGAPEPDPIQQAADQNPTAADLERAVAGWVDVEVTPLAVGDLVTADELKNAVGWDDLYLVDGRFAIGIRYKSDIEIAPEVQALIDEYGDTFAQLSNVLHRTQYTYNSEAFTRTMSTATAVDIDSRNRALRRTLMQEHGVRIGSATVPVSRFTLHHLGR